METKICIRCLQEKPIEDFPYKSFVRKTRQTVCKVCTAENSSRWYAENKEYHQENVRIYRQKVKQEAREYVYQYLLTHPCVSCGETDPRVLEFHHVKEKNREIAKMIGEAHSIEHIAAEISRCQVLCANCHRRLTATEKGWFKGRR